MPPTLLSEDPNQAHDRGNYKTIDGDAKLNSIDISRNATYQGIQLGGNAQAQFGDQYHHGITINTTNLNLNDTSFAPRSTFGLCLGSAPQLEQDAFVGRSAELLQLQKWFSQTQRVVSIVGMGGLGKTQLSLAYAREYGMNYTSVLWVNAKDELSLRQNFCGLADMIMAGTSYLMTSTTDERSKVENVKRWLSEEWNDRWLMIFDNYDNPDLPNIHSKSGFNIRSYFPYRAHGHILITTRTPKLHFSKRLMLKKFEDIDCSLAVLAQRAGRDLAGDTSARVLADRLDGLPLALATAGVYLSQTNASCMEYLELYQSAWMDLHGPESEELLEYEDRTLASTWVISMDQVRTVDPDAAELLKFWAYFSNKDIWYELIRAGSEQGPAWMSRITANKIRFDRAMARLQDYSLVEVTTGSYNIHPCIHTWIFSYFGIDQTAFLTSLRCIMNSVPPTVSMQYWDISHRLLLHIDRLDDDVFQDLWEELAFNHSALNYLTDSAALLYTWDRCDQSKRMYTRALAGYQRTLGHNHPSTLCATVNLALLNANQGRWEEADKMYLEALAGYERMPSSDPLMAIDICHNLGLSYRDQAKFKEAEEMLLRALKDVDATLGHEHPSRLRILNHLGLVFWDQDHWTKAEDTLTQALIGSEKALGKTHPSTLHIVNNLGMLYHRQGLEDQSEKMLLRALTGREAILGFDHTLTLDSVDNLGVLYRNQGRYERAEELFRRVLSAFQGRPISLRLSGTVSNLVQTLHKGIKAGDISRQDAKRLLARVLPCLENARYDNRFNDTSSNDKYHTARVLLEIGDEENALAAFLHARGVVCDGCDRTIIPTQGEYYVCRQCVDVDLCYPCKLKCDENTLTLQDCKGHEYFDVGAAMSRFPDRARKLDMAGMKAWMERLREEYPIIDDT